jgi:hypothetical protein
MLDGAPLAQSIIHFDLEETGLAAPGGLGAVECRIGIVEQGRCVSAVGRENGNADADADTQLLTVQFQVGSDGRLEAPHQNFGERRLIAVRCDERELVAPEPRQISVAGEFTQLLR